MHFILFNVNNYHHLLSKDDPQKLIIEYNYVFLVQIKEINPTKTCMHFFPQFYFNLYLKLNVVS